MEVLLALSLWHLNWEKIPVLFVIFIQNWLNIHYQLKLIVLSQIVVSLDLDSSESTSNLI